MISKSLRPVAEMPPELTWDELRRLMATMGPHDSSVVRTIAPEIANRISEELNTHNRRKRGNKIGEYRDAMLKGAWSINGSTIVFTDKHRLGDGQNRLHGCCAAGVPFATHVVFGVPDAAFDTIDAGQRRDHADVLTLLGAKHPRDTAIAVKWAEWFETGAVKSRPLYNPQLLGQLYLTKHKAVEDFIPEARKIASINQLSTGMVAGFLYTIDQIDSDLAAEFATAWWEGSRRPPFQGLTTMQTRLNELRGAGALGGHRHEVMRAAMAVNAWNAARRGGHGVIRWDPEPKNRPFPLFRDPATP